MFVQNLAGDGVLRFESSSSQNFVSLRHGAIIEPQSNLSNSLHGSGFTMFCTRF